MHRKPIKRVNMHMVAQRAGVSQTTVSLVINNSRPESIPDETRQRVMRSIEELGYRPNAAARRMRTSRSHFIGFITDEIATSPHAGMIFKGAQDVAWESNKILLLINTGGKEAMERAALEVLLEQEVEGIIYAAMFHHAVKPLEPLRERPAVLLDCFVEDRSIAAVIPDEVNGGYVATAALLEKGHRRIAFANFDVQTPGAVGRLKGYQQALTAYGLRYDESLLCADIGEADGGYRATLRLFDRPDRPTALFCFNDRMAMGAYDALRKLGLSIPGDVAVIGFDNQEIIANHLHPSLSTVELPHYQMGQQAVKYLLEQFGKELDEISPVQYVVKCPLVLRDSV